MDLCTEIGCEDTQIPKLFSVIYISSSNNNILICRCFFLHPPMLPVLMYTLFPDGAVPAGFDAKLVPTAQGD